MTENNENQQNDFDSSDYSNRIDTLEEFKKEFEGEKFYEKICVAMEKSIPVENRIKEIVWTTVKTKLNWIILTGIGLVIIDLILRAVPSLLSNIG